MSSPKFSIVIPTKNRPQYLEDSILSVLKQDYNDYELIVSDNFNEPSTSQIINKYLENPRVKYLRTDSELSMIDHWEFATLQATGQYVILLPDRKLLLKGSLKKLDALIKSNNPKYNCISYGTLTYDDINKKMGWSPAYSNKKEFKTSSLLKNFLECGYQTKESLDIYYPKTLNSCYKNSYAQEIRKQNGNYFNLKGVTTPDYSSFFINMFSNESILFSGFNVILSQGEQVSNGRNFGQGRYESYMKTLGEINPFAYLPIKVPYIYNLLLNDLLVVQKKMGLLNRYAPNWVNYYFSNYIEYFFFKSHDNNNSFFIENWESALKKESTEIIEQVNSKIKAYKTADEKRKKLFTFHLHLIDYLKNNYSNNRIINYFLKHKFKSALQAAGFTE